MTTLPKEDPELRAMGQVLEAVAPLSPELQRRVLQWVATKLQVQGVSYPSGGPLSEETQPSQPPHHRRERREGTVSNVALKLEADSCRTLLIAAAAHLSLYQGKDSFPRAELISCAKEARGWKADYNTQIPTIIGRLLTSSFLFEKVNDVFSVSDGSLRELEAKLAV